MDKIIYADIDATLLDFSTSFSEYLKSQGVNVDRDLRQEKGLSSLGIDWDTELNFVYNFFKTDDVFKLAPLDHSTEIVKKLAIDGWKFIAISACPSSKEIRENRKKNLEDVFDIEFLDCHTTGVEGCKKSILENYTPTIWVEDNYHNAIVGHGLGYRTFLLNYEYNKSGPECPLERVDSWKEIYKRICMVN